MNKDNQPTETSDRSALFYKRFEEIANSPTYMGKDAIKGITRIGEPRETSYHDNNSVSQKPIYRKSWTYAELNNNANYLANLLFKIMPQNDDKPPQIVATYLGRSMDTVMANLAAHKAGAGFLNLDELNDKLEGFDHFLGCLKQPSEINNKKPYDVYCILTTRDLWEPIEKELKKREKIQVNNLVFLNQNILRTLINSDKHGLYDKATIHYLDSEYITNQDDKNAPFGAGIDDIAYIKYSSGTTGDPKGIMISHRGIMSRIETEVELFAEADKGESETENIFGYTEGNLKNENVIQIVEQSIDASFSEMVMALAWGATLHVVDKDTLLDDSMLWQFLVNNNISTIKAIPSLLLRLVDYAKKSNISLDALTSLKRIFTTGEAGNKDLITKLLNGNIRRIYFNAYGPTEATFGVAVNLIKKNNIDENCIEHDTGNNKTKTYVSVGLPMKGTRLLIIDKDEEDESKQHVNGNGPRKFKILAEITQTGPTCYSKKLEGELIVVDDEPDIGGIAIGYSNNPTKDAAAFIEIDMAKTTISSDDVKCNVYEGDGRIGKKAILNPDAQRRRAYRTGDAVCIVNEKVLVLGRYDRQVKINGRYPVDLAEIEELLREALATKFKRNKDDFIVKILYRHQEYARHPEPQNIVDDHHIVAFINTNEGDTFELSSSDLEEIYKHMRNKTEKGIGIPSLWSTYVNRNYQREATQSVKTWKASNTNDWYIQQLWSAKPGAFRAISEADSHIPYEDTLSMKVASVWQELLFERMYTNEPNSKAKTYNIHIGPKTDFYKIGGNSLLVSILLSKVEHEFRGYGKIKVIPDNFLRESTLECLVRDVRTALSKTCKFTPVKHVKGPANDLPIYIFSAPMATEDSYTGLRLLLPQNEIYQFDTTPGEVSSELQSQDFSESAEIYMSSLIANKNHQANEPYILIGYSSAGILAFETAKKLRAKGYNAIVTLIDSPCPTLIQKMTYEAYYNHIKEKVIHLFKTDTYFNFSEDLSHFQTQENHNKNFNEPSNNNEQTLRRDKMNLVSKLRDYLHKHSSYGNHEMRNDIPHHQTNKINVIMDYLQAELTYEMKHDNHLDFPCQLITSTQFRSAFSNNEAQCLGWPFKLFSWGEFSNVTPLDGDHFHLVQKDKMAEKVAASLSDFIKQSNAIIQAQLNFLRAKQMTDGLDSHVDASNTTKCELFAITTSTKICYQHYSNNSSSANHSVFPIYINHKVAQYCLQQSNGALLDHYFRYLAKVNHSLPKIEENVIKQVRIRVHVDHIYDVVLLSKLHLQLVSQQDYTVDKVLYTIDPHVYDRLPIGSELRIKANQSFPNDSSFLNCLVLNESPGSDKIWVADKAKIIRDYITERFILLARQNPEYDASKNFFEKLAFNYSMNLISLILTQPSRKDLHDLAAIGFALLLPINDNDESDFIYNIAPKILNAEDAVTWTVKFCCPLLYQVGRDISKITDDPKFVSFFRDLTSSKINQLEPKLQDKVNQVIHQFFTSSADRKSMLIINKVGALVSAVCEKLGSLQIQPLTEAWYFKVVIQAINYIIIVPEDIESAKLKLLARLLVTVRECSTDKFQMYASSLLLTLMKIYGEKYKNNMERELIHRSLLDCIKSNYLIGTLHLPDVEKPIDVSRKQFNIDIAIDLSGLNVSNPGSNYSKTIENIHFSGIDFSNSKFHSIIFINCEFDKINFDRAIFENCQFNHCNFKNSSFYESQFKGTKIFSNNTVDFTNCHLGNTTITNDASLGNVLFSQCILYNFYLENTNLKSVEFQNCDLTKMSFKRGKCEEVTFKSNQRHKFTAKTFDDVSIKEVNISVKLLTPDSIEYFMNKNGFKIDDPNSNSLSKNPKLNKFNDINKMSLSPDVGEYFENYLNTSMSLLEFFPLFLNHDMGAYFKDINDNANNIQRNFESRFEEFINNFNKKLVKAVAFQPAHEASSKQLLSNLMRANFSASEEEFCWVYHPKTNAKSIITENIRQNVVYTNLMDALLMTACDGCNLSPCSCLGEKFVTRQVEICRVQRQNLTAPISVIDIQVQSATPFLGQLYREPFFALDTKLLVESVGKLTISPEVAHPLFAKRVKITKVPTYQAYSELVNGKYDPEMTELNRLLDRFHMALSPVLVRIRVEILKDIQELIINNQSLAVKDTLDLQIIETELNYLKLFLSVYKKSVSSTSTYLTATLSSILKNDKESAIYYYDAVLKSVTKDTSPSDLEKLTKIRGVIEQLSDSATLLPSSLIENSIDDSPEDLELRYALAYYQAGNDLSRKKILQAYQSDSSIPCKRLIRNQSGWRVVQCMSVDIDQLIKYIGITSIDDQDKANNTYLNRALRKTYSSFLKWPVYYVSQSECMKINTESKIYNLLIGETAAKYIISCRSLVDNDFPEQRIFLLRLQNPITHMKMVNLFRRLHGIVVPQHYVSVKNEIPFMISANLIAMKQDDLERLNNYTATWKLFEICILGIHSDEFKQSYAIKTPYNDNVNDYYPTYSSDCIDENHEKVQWDNYFSSKNDRINQLATAELMFLEPGQLVNRWMDDNEDFEINTLNKHHEDSKKIDAWKHDSPNIEIKVYEVLYKFRRWMLENNSGMLTFKQIFEQFRNYILTPQTQEIKHNDTKTPSTRDELRRKIWNNLRCQSELVTALRNGEDCSKVVEKILPEFIFQTLAEFDLIKAELTSIKCLIDKIMSSGYTHVSLNNPTTDQLSHLSQVSKLRSIKITNVRDPLLFDIKKFPDLEIFVADNCKMLELTCESDEASTFKVDIQLTSGTEVTKFVGDSAVLEKLAPNLTYDANITIPASATECLQNAETYATSNADIARVYALAGLGKEALDPQLKGRLTTIIKAQSEQTLCTEDIISENDVSGEKGPKEADTKATPSPSNHIRTYLNDDGRTLALISTKFITVKISDSADKRDISGNFCETDKISLDHAGKHILVFRHSYLILIRAGDPEKNEPDQMAILADHNGLLGACLSKDGKYLLYSLNDNSEMPYKIIQTEYLLKNCAKAIASLPMLDVPEKLDTSHYRPMALSDDKNYFCILNKDGIHLGSVGNTELTLIDGYIPIYDGDRSVIKLQFQNFDTGYRIAIMTKTEFTVYEMIPPVDESDIISCRQSYSANINEIEEPDCNNSTINFNGNYFKNFIMHTSANTAILENDNNEYSCANFRSDNFTQQDLDTDNSIQIWTTSSSTITHVADKDESKDIAQRHSSNSNISAITRFSMFAPNQQTEAMNENDKKSYYAQMNMTNPAYWYSIHDGICLLRHIRSKLVLTEEANEDRENPYRENNQHIFISDPYHHSNFEDYFNDDILRLTGQGVFKKPWAKMPNKIIIPLLNGLHWICILININYQERSVNIRFNDPYGEMVWLPDINEAIKSGVRSLIIYMNEALANENCAFVISSDEIDQQGRGINASDCGVITFSNIEDYACDRQLTINAHDSPGHSEHVKSRRASDAAIVGVDAQEMAKADSMKIKQLETDLNNYRHDFKMESECDVNI